MPTAFDGTSKAIRVKETIVNQPISTVTSTMPASPKELLASLIQSSWNNAMIGKGESELVGGLLSANPQKMSADRR